MEGFCATLKTENDHVGFSFYSSDDFVHYICVLKKTHGPAVPHYRTFGSFCLFFNYRSLFDSRYAAYSVALPTADSVNGLLMGSVPAAPAREASLSN